MKKKYGKKRINLGVPILLDFGIYVFANFY